VSADGPRIGPLARDAWDEEAVAALRKGLGDEVADRFLAATPDAPRTPNAVATILRHPQLFRTFFAYNGRLLSRPVLEPRWRELAVLRVAWRTHSLYEWVQHVRLAPRYGITTDEIKAVAGSPDRHAWSPLEADLLEATDQLLDRYWVDDETWAGLASQLDERQLIEFAFVVGTYTCLAMVFKSFGLELDPELRDVDTPPFDDSGA
jgi:alkylhydroperoxidase family enzyme